MPIGFRLAQLDAIKWLGEIPSGSVDLAITDPPYESLEKRRAVGTTTRLKHSKAPSNDWFQYHCDRDVRFHGRQMRSDDPL